MAISIMRGSTDTPPPMTKLKDPVCGMDVTEQSHHSAEHEGRHYYSCSAKCQTKFVEDPDKYAVTPPGTDKVAREPEATQPGTIYTCPMHPEVQQDHPGNCPKCGMTLEPMLPTLDEGENAELVDFRHRFWWTLPLTVVVTILAMVGHRLQWFEMGTQSWIELVLTVPIVLWAGWPFFVRGAQSIANRSPNMWTLIGLGTGAAFVYSAVATVAPGVFPASFQARPRGGVLRSRSCHHLAHAAGPDAGAESTLPDSAAIKSLLGLAPPRPHGVSTPTVRRVIP